MSDMELHKILCDFGEDCETEPPFVSTNIRVTREQAAMAGWTRGTGGEDFCPEHSRKAWLTNG